jgi:uncharacterized membrane protein YcaP (DUF421 family)
MWDLGTPPLELVARTIIVYLLFFGALRLFGKREVGQFTLFDLALILLAANALQPALTGPDQSIFGAAIIIATMFAFNRVVSELRARVPFVQRLLEFAPTVLGRDGKWLTDEMERQGVDQEDVDAALREHGLDSVEQLKLATLEEDGSISIVGNDDTGDVQARRRRRRYRRPM